MKILLIDDHALFRDGIVLLLEDLNLGCEIFEASSYEQAKDLMAIHGHFDLILLDLGLPGMSYLEALQSIREQLPNSPVAVLSGTEDKGMIEQAFSYGVSGYLLKSLSTQVISKALQLILSGGVYVPSKILQNTINNNNTINLTAVTLEQALTPRQCDVLKELAKGLSNKEIGRILNLTESTVRVHVAAILRSFNVKNRTQAVQYALQHSWLKIPPN